MKRSRCIELSLMSALPIVLTACNGGAPAASPPLYRSLAECTAAGRFPEAVCRSEYERAVALHEQQAPQFASRGECKALYEDCLDVRRDDGSSIFLPAMAGYLIGSALKDRRDDPHGGYAGGGYGGYGGAWVGQPIYRDRGYRASWSTRGGERFGAAEGARGPAAMSTAETLSRGGFGMSSAARGGWGG